MNLKYKNLQKTMQLIPERKEYINKFLLEKVVPLIVIVILPLSLSLEVECNNNPSQLIQLVRDNNNNDEHVPHYEHVEQSNTHLILVKDPITTDESSVKHITISVTN